MSCGRGITVIMALYSFFCLFVSFHYFISLFSKGKSTLLDVLANKKTGGTLSGTLLMNGQPRGVDFAHVSGYVEQWDSHHPYSTVRESLEFSGRLRLREPVSDDELARRVDNVLAILGIEHLQDQLIGGDGIAGVSQEVRKKVTIGVELVTEPILLFLDEPTVRSKSTRTRQV